MDVRELVEQARQQLAAGDDRAVLETLVEIAAANAKPEFDDQFWDDYANSSG